MARSSTLVGKVRSMFTTGTGTSLKQAFRNQQQEALDLWRKAVADHLAGRSIDISALAVAGPQIGVQQADVPAAFSKDCDTYREFVELEEHANRMDAAADEAEKLAIGAAGEIERLNQELAAAIQRRDAGVWSRVGAAHSRSPANHIRRSNPRLFDDGRDIDAVQFEAGLSLPVEPLATKSGSEFDADGTGWIVSDDD